MELIYRFLGDGTLTFNEACYHSFDQDRRAWIGQKFFPFIAAEDKAVLKQQLASLNRENPVLTTEFQVMINNEICWQWWPLQAILDAQQHLSSIARNGTREHFLFTSPNTSESPREVLEHESQTVNYLAG